MDYARLGPDFRGRVMAHEETRKPPLAPNATLYFEDRLTTRQAPRVPMEVAAHAGLTRGQKIEILRSWEYDAAAAKVATEEGMPGGNGELLRRIVPALDVLTGGVDVGDSAPTKQHAFLRRRPGPS